MKVRWPQAIVVVVLAGCGLVVVLLLRPSLSPDIGPGLFQDENGFRRYVEGLGLAGIPSAAAMERLREEGFRCDQYDGGAATCYRKVSGTGCGERQFVDLKPAPTAAGPLGVSVRFGLACR